MTVSVPATHMLRLTACKHIHVNTHTNTHTNTHKKGFIQAHTRTDAHTPTPDTPVEPAIDTVAKCFRQNATEICILLSHASGDERAPLLHESGAKRTHKGSVIRGPSLSHAVKESVSFDWREEHRVLWKRFVIYMLGAAKQDIVVMGIKLKDQMHQNND